MTSASTSTRTSTPTATTTPFCGFTSVSVPTPVNAPSAPGTFFYVIRTLADWQNYYGSTSAPTPPANLGSQMILINLQSVPVTDIIYPSSPLTEVCGGTTFITSGPTSPVPPALAYSYSVSVQNVCSTSGQMTVSYAQYTLCPPYSVRIVPIPGQTPMPTSTPSPQGSPCNPGQIYMIYLYDAVGVVVPATNLPVIWNQSGTLLIPGLLCPIPA
jgi:hypothetical protein